MLATAAALVILVVGTLWGQDDDFPFGPFRMYSIRNELDGHIRGAVAEVGIENGNAYEVEIRADQFGLRRAELEGQLSRSGDHTDVAKYLASAYNKLHPDETITRLRLYYETTSLENGRPAGEPSRTLIAEWQQR
jgi:hypothetical protein